MWKSQEKELQKHKDYQFQAFERYLFILQLSIKKRNVLLPREEKDKFRLEIIRKQIIPLEFNATKLDKCH